MKRKWRGEKEKVVSLCSKVKRILFFRFEVMCTTGGRKSLDLGCRESYDSPKNECANVLLGLCPKYEFNWITLETLTET